MRVSFQVGKGCVSHTSGWNGWLMCCVFGHFDGTIFEVRGFSERCFVVALLVFCVDLFSL